MKCTLIEIDQQQRSKEGNRPMAEKKSRDLNFEEASKNLYLIFSANYQTVILEKLLANVQKLLAQI
jgi:hypothetical protein